MDFSSNSTYEIKDIIANKSVCASIRNEAKKELCIRSENIANRMRATQKFDNILKELKGLPSNKSPYSSLRKDIRSAFLGNIDDSLLVKIDLFLGDLEVLKDEVRLLGEESDKSKYRIQILENEVKTLQEQVSKLINARSVGKVPNPKKSKKG